MASKLPPLHTLQGFIACARSENFSKTASDLNLTQGAISKQISQLEDYLGMELFKRDGRFLKLTKPAEIYSKKLESALENIESATSEIIAKKDKEKEKEVININILPSMGSIWLTPNLQDFRRKFPHYDVVVKIGDGDIDLKKEKCDLAIRVATRKNKAEWRKYKIEKIMDEKLLCVASPEFTKKSKIENVKYLLKYNLLGHTHRPKIWHKYFKSFGLKKFQIHHSDSFEHFFLLIEALKNNMGIGLIPKFLIRKDLEKKELVKVIKGGFESPYSYFLLSQRQKEVPEKVADFTKWLKEVV